MKMNAIILRTLFIKNKPGFIFRDFLIILVHGGGKRVLLWPTVLS